MSEYERVFGGMFYFSANHTNSRLIKLKITGSEPLPYRKEMFHMHDGLNPGEMPSYSAYHQDQTMCISHGIKNMMKIMTVFHLPKQDRNRNETENDFNSTRYYECACFLLQTSQINKLIINIKCPLYLNIGC